MSWFGFGKKPSAQSDFKVLAENAQRNVDAVTAAQQAKAAAEQAVKEAKERADLAVKETAQRAAIAKAFEDASLGGKNTITFVEEKDIHPTIAKELKDTGYTITAGTPSRRRQRCAAPGPSLLNHRSSSEKEHVGVKPLIPCFVGATGPSAGPSAGSDSAPPGPASGTRLGRAARR